MIISKNKQAYVEGKGYVCYPTHGSDNVYFFSEEIDTRQGVGMITLLEGDSEKAEMLTEELQDLGYL